MSGKRRRPAAKVGYNSVMDNERRYELPWYRWHVVTCILMTASASVLAWTQAGVAVDTRTISYGWPLRYNALTVMFYVIDESVVLSLPLCVNLVCAIVLVLCVGLCSELVMRNMQTRLQFSLGVLISVLVVVAILLGDYRLNIGNRLARELALQPVMLFVDVPIVPSCAIYLSISCTIYVGVWLVLGGLGWIYPIGARHPRITISGLSASALIIAAVCSAVAWEANRQREAVAALREADAYVTVTRASSFTSPWRDIYYCSRVRNIALRRPPPDGVDFAQFSNLETFVMRDDEMSDITFLNESTSLNYLSVKAQVTDISTLARLENLETLYLTGNPVTDASPLSGLTKLERLSLVKTKVTDVTCLAALPNLQELYLKDTAVSDVTPISHLSKLQTLDLSGTNVVDVSLLSDLTQLTYLDISGTNVRDIWPLYGMPSLREINIRNTPISREDRRAFREAMPQCTLTGWLSYPKE